MSKRETIEEFLQRGGTITKVPPQETPEEDGKITTSKSGPAQMMSLSEGSVYYAETKAKKAPKKKVDTIDFSVLPAHLMKFLPTRDE